jgi:16S rRNA G966 N2-methylase RsmD
MKRPRSTSRVLPLIVGCLLVAAGVQAQQAQPAGPEIGQAGKDVIWKPTSDALVEKMLDVAKVTPQDYLIDLGSGDGRLVFAAAKRGARALGIEYDPDLVQLSKRSAAALGVDAKATFVKADLFESDFSQATVITMFLLPSINLQLRPKILALKPGTRVVSNTFTMREWEPDETVEITPCDHWCKALFWIVPANVAGTWRLPQGDVLDLRQQFQMLTGTLGAASLVDARMRGDRITFTANGALHVGRVSGETIRGTATSHGHTSEWVATRVYRQ